MRFAAIIAAPLRVSTSSQTKLSHRLSELFSHRHDKSELRPQLTGWQYGSAPSVRSLAGRAGMLWGLGGVLLLLLYAILRLSLIAIDAFEQTFHWWHWLILVTNTAFMAHSEGYKGFHKAYSPRVVARARVILDSPTAIRVLLAPLFCMCFFDSTRRRLAVTYVLTGGIVVLLTVFHYLPQPLRGILDFGVVLGLSWGVASIGYFMLKAWTGQLDHSPELAP